MAWAAIYGGYLVGSYIYHRITAEHPPKPKPAKEIEVPRTDDGAAYPLIYGTCRVRSPILAWAMNPNADGSGPWRYSMDFMMIVGIPFTQGQIRIGRIWVDETRLGPVNPQWTKAPGSPAAQLSATDLYVMDSIGTTWESQSGYIGGYIEVFDGNASQLFIDPVTLTELNSTANAMTTANLDADKIPSYRGFASVAHLGGIGSANWDLGEDNVMGAYSYEVCSQPPGYAWGTGSNGFTAIDANPIDVIYDLLTGTFGKLNLPGSKVDAVSFQSARQRLWEEVHGYSRSIEDAVDAEEIIREICIQIDAVLYEDPRDGLIKIKLVRDDYAVADLPHVTVSNCEEIESFAAGSYEGAVNKVRVIFTNRDDLYRDGSGTAHALSSAAGLNGDVREILIRMPGVCTQALANTLAARELAARSRPIAKCRVVVSREFHTVNPGDVIKLTWPEYGIDARVFRIGAVDRGSLENGRIALDLLEDFYNVFRGEVQPGNPWAPPSFPNDAPQWEPAPGGGGVPWGGGGGGGGSEPTDGDKGDITVSGSGTIWNIDPGVVGTTELADGGVTFAKMQDISSPRLLGRATVGTGDIEQLTGTAATALLDVFTTSVKGLVPAATGGSTTTQYLRKDGTWVVPPGTGVTSTGIFGLFGGGHDGPLVFDGAATILGMVPASNVYTLSRDIFPTDITIDSGVTLITNNYRVFANGTTTNNGLVHNRGNSAVGATGATGVTPTFFGLSGGGGNGGTGAGGAAGTAVTVLPPFPGAATNSVSLAGAIAGNGSNGNVTFRGGGSGGGATLRAGATAGATTITTTTMGGPTQESIQRGAPAGNANRYTGGSGGAGGSAGASGSGGGGGAGGGIIYWATRVLTGSGTFSVAGGAGAAGTGASGGGGGGGGGLLNIQYGTRAGSLTMIKIGGAGAAGAGGAGAGGNGADGWAELVNLSGDGT